MKIAVTNLVCLYLWIDMNNYLIQDMQPIKVGHGFVYILGVMLLFRFWYKGNHSLNPKCYIVCTFPLGNAPFWILSRGVTSLGENARNTKDSGSKSSPSFWTSVFNNRRMKSEYHKILKKVKIAT